MAMAGKVAVFLLLLALVYKAAEAEVLSTTDPGPSNPQQCVDNSGTPVSCAEQDSPDAVVPHLDDCELFYHCVSPDSAPICRQCSAHLYFNPEKRVCDLPEDAGCEAATIIVPISN